MPSNAKNQDYLGHKPIVSPDQIEIAIDTGEKENDVRKELLLTGEKDKDSSMRKQLRPGFISTERKARPDMEEGLHPTGSE